MATISERGLDERNGSDRPVLRSSHRRADQGRRRGDPRDREAVRPRLDHEARVVRAAGGRRHPDRLDRPGPGPRRRRHPARPDHRDLRPRVIGQDHGLPAHHRRGAAPRRRGRVHRRRACPRPGLRPGLRGQRRRAPGQPAGHRRAGARDHRDPDPLGRDRHASSLDSVAALVPRAEIEGEMGDSFVGDPGPADEPGPAQADRRGQPLEHRPRLHQPAAREDRGDVRQPGDDAGRPRPQVLRQRPARHPADRDDQDRHRVGRQPGPGQGRQEQGRRAVPGRRVRRDVRRGDQQGRRPARRRRGDGRRHQDRGLVHLRRHPSRPGPRGVEGLPAGESADRSRRSSARSGPRSTRSRSRSKGSSRPSRPVAARRHVRGHAGRRAVPIDAQTGRPSTIPRSSWRPACASSRRGHARSTRSGAGWPRRATGPSWSTARSSG